MSKRQPADSSGDRSNSKSSRLDDGSRGGYRRSGTRGPLIMYKETEPLRDLSLSHEREGGAELLEIRVPAHCLTSNNRHVRSRQLWGCDLYTDDSDVVAVLMHCGYWSLFLAHPPAVVAEVRVLLRTHPPRPSYPSVARNNIRSRAWAAPVTGCSFAVERAWVVLRSGQSVDLAANLDGLPLGAPTFTPSHHERILTRSSAGSGARLRTAQEVTVVFNLANEPWLKYSAAAVADRGLRPHEWTSARMRTATLYLESHTHRYELSRVAGEEGATDEQYRFARCAEALPRSRMRQLGVPLPGSEVTVLCPDLSWEELQWAQHGVKIRDKFYALVRLQFVTPADLEEHEKPV
ncbi:CPL1 [Auxenochlorella protothecoides x Auxenochlorella symbiontica]